MNKELSLREIQVESLKILKVIDSICEEQHLRYFLYAGSLIGAARHKGFIPWDDDLDICMPRSDYEEFLKYFDSHSNDLMPLVCLHSTEDSPLPFLITRISNTNFKMIGEYGYELDNLGAFVDVYSLDSIKHEVWLEGGAYDDCKKIVRNFVNAYNPRCCGENCSYVKKLAKSIRAHLLGDVRKRYAQFISFAHDITQPDADLFVDLWSCGNGEKAYYDAKDFEESIRMDFEDIKANIPAGYNHVLTSMYGDYMQLPPEEDRVGHHKYALVCRNVVNE